MSDELLMVSVTPCKDLYLRHDMKIERMINNASNSNEAIGRLVNEAISEVRKRGESASFLNGFTFVVRVW